MAEELATPPSHSGHRNGYSAAVETFRSIRQAAVLPPESLPLSITAYIFSLLPSPLPSHPALIESASGTAVSYSDLIHAVRNLSHSLITDARISKGDVAFILAPSCHQIPVIYLALLSFGAVAAPYNPAATACEVSRLVSLTNPKIAFATTSTAAKLPTAAGLEIILLDSPRFLKMMSAGAPAVMLAEVRQSDVAVIQFSSGTTGRVKAAAIPHRSIIAQIAEHILPRKIGYNNSPKKRADVILLSAPVFHSMGFFFIMKGIALGGSTVVLTGRPGINELLASTEKYKATELTAAPPVVVAMARSEEVLRHDLSAVERVISGGAPLSEDAAVKFHARFPHVELRQGLGSTEGGSISMSIGAEECSRLRSVGRLWGHVEAKIVSPDTGKALAVGQTGELWLRSPFVMSGYIGDSEANNSAFTSDGWLKTGDLCYFDQDGFLYVVDRLKELIKYKGYQVPPAELEELLQSLADVVDAAVVPYPNEEVGEIPMACIVRRQGSSLNEAQIMDFIANKVAPYKKIRRVAFIKSIPRNPAGKILRRELISHSCKSYSSSM